MDVIDVNRFVAKSFQTAEALKTLRTNVMFSGVDVKTIALTSYSASEGKSTVSFQLAASMAQAGKRVLLMEADLRKGVLAARLKLRGGVKGLSHYLSGMLPFQELLYETDIKGLYIVFSGPRVPNAAELLGGANFSTLLEALKDMFDYVIVDAPPLGQVIDCAVMAPRLDGILLVVDANHNSYKLTRRIKAQLDKSGGKVLGVVLNNVDFNGKHGYYGKAYGYGYGAAYTDEG
jgi:capsular exopolysaccharide synthesis family protein